MQPIVLSATTYSKLMRRLLYSRLVEILHNHGKDTSSLQFASEGIGCTTVVGSSNDPQNPRAQPGEDQPCASHSGQSRRPGESSNSGHGRLGNRGASRQGQENRNPAANQEVVQASQ